MLVSGTLAGLFDLTGRVAIVTGASQGIGRAIAIGLAQAGAHLVLAKHPEGRRAEIVALKAEIEALGRRVEIVTTDVSDVAQVRALMDRTKETFGRIDILVNNAGWTGNSMALDTTEEEFDRTMESSLKSVFFACTRVGKHMLAAGSGSIINIASIAAFGGFRRTALYTMSKHGVVGLTETLAIEWATRGVRVNAIAPGFFITALNREKMDPERKAHAIGRTPIGRFGELDELVNAALYRASPGASYVTGETLRVDGGFLAGRF